MKFPGILSPDHRRAWAFAAICGGCFVFTVFAAVGVWLVSGNARYSFYLALAAHAQILVGMTALAAQFVKRTIKAGRAGIEITDTGEPNTATATTTTTLEIKDAPG